MDRNELMEAVRQRTFAARMSLYALAEQSKVSGTSITRWVQGRYTPSLRTIGKLEKRLDEIEAER